MPPCSAGVPPASWMSRTHLARWQCTASGAANGPGGPPAVSPMATTTPATAEHVPPASERRSPVPARLAGLGIERWFLGLVISVCCWLFAPKQSDLAAAAFRSDLFDAHGLLIYNAQWYGGHHLLASSLLSPPLGAWLGPMLLGAICTVISVILFERIVALEFGGWAARAGALTFAVTAGASLLVGRIAFQVGLALGLLAVYLAQRNRWGLACVAAALSAVGSPLAGLFLALAAAAWTLAMRSWLRGTLLIGFSLVPALILQYAFREGGTFPYARISWLQAVATGLACLIALPRFEKPLRYGFALFLGLSLFAEVVASPLGGNVNRVGTIFAGPLLVCALWGYRNWVMFAVAQLAFAWAIQPVVRDLPDAVGAMTEASYYAPLRAELAKLPGPLRLEIPPTRNHWEGVYIGEHFMIARGWERQLDQKYAHLFYGTVVTPANYRHYLARSGVQYVALSDAPSDFASKSEADLLRQAPPPYLKPIWSNEHWRLFRVAKAAPLLTGPGRLVGQTPDTFTVDARRPGRFVMRLHFSPYWAITSGSGCVSSAAGGWTKVTLRRRGVANIGMRFSPSRVVSSGPRCS